MMPRAGYRGQPLFMLAVLLGGWIVLRVVTWASPFPDLVGSDPVPAIAAIPARPLRPASLPSAKGVLPVVLVPSPAARSERSEVRAHGFGLAGQVEQAPGSSVREAELAPAPSRPASSARTGNPPSFAAPLPLPPSRPAASVPARWSADGWLLLRKDTTTPITSGRGSYGQSQAGAVLRYRFARSSGHRPFAYVRLSHALGGARESEAAAGLAARPIPGLPVSVAAELRAMRVGGRMFVRPSAFAVTELAPFALPLGFTGEAYAQAGYVGGDFATAFVDGQMRVERELLRLGDVRLRAGGGVWGGAQRRVSRLDAGPGVTVGMRPGGMPARLSLDWRLRVAGKAEPSNGPALTISAGF